MRGTISTPPSAADVTFVGKTAGDNLGFTFAETGDLNGDQYDDFLLAAPYSDDVSTNGGAVYVVFGSKALSGTVKIQSSTGLTILGKGYDFLGQNSLAGLGDINGDGYDDIAVGSYKNDDFGLNKGLVYVFFGSSSLGGTCNLLRTCSADLTIIGGSVGSSFGLSVSAAGDFNDDGFNDILAQQTDKNAYIFFGSRTFDAKNLSVTSDPDVTLLQAAAFIIGNPILSSAGDVNRDGFSDVITAKGSANSAVYIFFGSKTAPDQRDTGKGDENVRIRETTLSSPAVGGGRGKTGP